MSIAQSKNATTDPTSFQLAVLSGLQSKPLYGGTVDPVTVSDRRRKNRAARASRRVNRKRAGR